MRTANLSLSFCFIALFLATLLTGEAAFSSLFASSLTWNPLLDERLPRLIVLLCTGASLTVSGMVLQSLFQNPLASPSILGISCGGSLAVITAFIFGFHLHYPYSLAIAAFTGSLFSLFSVYGLSKKKGVLHLGTLILSGLAISSLLLSIQSALLFSVRNRWDLIQTISEWEAGSTLHLTWKQVHLQLPPTLVGLFGIFYYVNEIDLLALGDEEAYNLGVDVSTIRFRLFVCVALLIAGSLATVGVIAFFGLVLPNLIRRLTNPIAKQLFPLSVLLGSLIFSWMDFFLRYFDIQAFSIGTVSAILGGLFFIVTLYESDC